MAIPRIDSYKIALKAAAVASEKIMEYYLAGFETEVKMDGSPVTQADLAASEIISQILIGTEIPITGEETVKEHYHIRKTWKQSWCVDPLDGTKEFIKRNGEFAVNIALIEDQQAVFGIIASPTEQKILFGGKNFGVFLTDMDNFMDESAWIKILPKQEMADTIVLTCSRSHDSGPILQYLHELKKYFSDVEFIKKGSSLKFFDLALGRADAYPRFAPTMEWDIAAGQAILEALGGEVIDYTTGKPLTYNKENLKNPFFIAQSQVLIQKLK